VLGTALTLYNKLLLGRKHGLLGRGAFPAPLLMSALQFSLQCLLAKAVFRSGLIARSPSPPLPWATYCRVVLPNGITTGLDIGLSNKSLVFITMSFYTMCKSTTPVFLLLFAFAMRIERPSWRARARARKAPRHLPLARTRLPPPPPPPPAAAACRPPAHALTPAPAHTAAQVAGGRGGGHRVRPAAAGGRRERV